MNATLTLKQPKISTRKWIGDIVAAFCGSIVIAMAAPISYHFSFTAVPITFQSQMVLLISFLLGSKRGPIAVMMFVSYALMGYPVLSSGAVGPAVFMGPTGGYVLGYIIASIMLHSFKSETRMQTYLMFTYANVAMYFFGVVWLATYVGYAKALSLGVYPFLVGDFIKNALITKLAFFPGINSTLQRLGKFI